MTDADEPCCGGAAEQATPRSRGRKVEVQTRGKAPTFECVHRGRVATGKVECPDCKDRGKRVDLLVYDCATFGSCTLTPSPGVPGCCKGCPTMTPPAANPVSEVRP